MANVQSQIVARAQITSQVVAKNIITSQVSTAIRTTVEPGKGIRLNGKKISVELDDFSNVIGATAAMARGQASGMNVAYMTNAIPFMHGVYVDSMRTAGAWREEPA